MHSSFPTKLFKQWFKIHKRDLPWRNNPSPYQVWVSEVMLQQTQVATVIPYYENWMAKYPTLHHLAEASLEEVIKNWEGLGYYSRARSLHAGAQYILAHFQGNIPSTLEELISIKGIGPYTAGALLNFAFHKKASAIDGNVMRVIARYFNLQEDLSKSSTKKIIHQSVEEILTDDEPWVISEGLIELGATLCHRKPQCRSCPLKESCRGYQLGTAAELPIKSKKIKMEFLYRNVAVICAEEKYLVRICPEGEIMAGLHEFPYFERGEEPNSDKKMIGDIKDRLGVSVHFKSKFSLVSHSFTRYQVKLYPYLFSMEQIQPVNGFIWISLGELSKLAFSSGHRKILKEISVK